LKESPQIKNNKKEKEYSVLYLWALLANAL